MTRLSFREGDAWPLRVGPSAKGAEATLRRLVDCGVAEARELEDGAVRVVGGVVTALARKWTKRGDLMATFVLEDLDGAMEVMVFPKTMQEWGSLLADDAIVCVKARVSTVATTNPRSMCLEVRRPEINFEAQTRTRSPNFAARCSPMPSWRAKSACSRSIPGDAEVVLRSGESARPVAGPNFRVDPGSATASPNCKSCSAPTPSCENWRFPDLNCHH